MALLFCVVGYNYATISGKGVQIWDTWTQGGNTDNNDTGNVACDSYNKVEDDVRILSGLGVSGNSGYRESSSYRTLITREVHFK